MKEKLKLLFTGEPGLPLGYGVAAVGFPLLAILLGQMGDAIASVHMQQVNTYAFQPVTALLGIVLGVLAITSARKVRRTIDDPRLRVAEVLAVIGILLLPIYLLVIG